MTDIRLCNIAQVSSEALPKKQQTAPNSQIQKGKKGGEPTNGFFIHPGISYHHPTPESPIYQTQAPTDAAECTSLAREKKESHKLITRDGDQKEKKKEKKGWNRTSR